MTCHGSRTKGLLRRALLGLRLIRDDSDLQAAIRESLESRQSDGFHDEQQRPTNQITALDVIEPERETYELPEQFDRVVEILNELDWDTIWDAATDTEGLLDGSCPPSTSTATTSSRDRT